MSTNKSELSEFLCTMLLEDGKKVVTTIKALDPRDAIQLVRLRWADNDIADITVVRKRTREEILKTPPPVSTQKAIALATKPRIKATATKPKPLSMSNMGTPLAPRYFLISKGS